MFFCFQIGDELYTDSVELLPSQFHRSYLTPSEIKSKVKIGNVELMFSVGDETIFGTIMKKGSDLDGKEPDDVKSYELSEGLNKSFTDCYNCVFITGDYSISIMKKWKYLLDS